MIRGRESSDRWARHAHRVLDRVRRGTHATERHIAWALAYLGDAPGGTKIPQDLKGGHRHPKERA